MKKLYARHSQKIQYLLIGGWNTVFGYGVFTALYYYGTARFNLHYIIPLLLSHAISVTSAYLIYKRFVFKTKGNFIREYCRFCTFYWFSLAANLILLPALVEVAGMNPIISQGLLIIVAAVTSYLWHAHYTFSPDMSVKKLDPSSR
ncbi:MAG: GtrA family protein [Nitrospirales bacterium]